MPIEKVEVENSTGTEHNSESYQGERLWIAILAVMVVVQLWFGLIGTSLWRDETGTWWVVKDGLPEVLRRSFSWGGVSPLYYTVTWAFTRLFGLSEISLRMPSVLAMCGAIYFLYRIAQRLLDRSTAAVAAFIFICLSAIWAIDARPYALAMLGLTSSTWGLLRWLDTRWPAYALLHIVAGAMVVYAQCLMALGLVGIGVYAIAVLRKQPRQLAWLGGFWVSVVLLCIPALRQLQMFYSTRASHTVVGAPRLNDFLASVLPGSPAGAVTLGVWIFMVFARKTALPKALTSPAALLIAIWALFAQLFLFLLPIFADVRLFVDRYYSSGVPGQALLLATLIGSIRPPVARKALLVVLATISILMQGRISVRSHKDEDWRAALEFVRKEAGSTVPVMLQSGFAEGADFASLQDPRLRDVLFAPVLVYGEPVRSIRLPHVFDGTDGKDVEHVVRQVEIEPRFLYLQADYDRSFEMWLLGKLGPRCSSTVSRTFATLTLTQFNCKSR